MSVYPDREPVCSHADSAAIELVVGGRPRDLGGFTVRRVLPSVERRLVGPFIFFDHMGPVVLAPGHGVDVRPHPHIALATLTYLFDGELVHRDSLGSHQPIRPGDVNWMIAGSGIAHSERSGEVARREGARLHGIQTWLALPLEDEEMPPRFEHHAEATIPRVTLPGVTLDVVAGASYGARAPVTVRSPTLYAHARFEPGARLDVDDAHEERAVYVVEGEILCDGRAFREGTMVVLRRGARASIEAEASARAMIVGGAKLAGDRQIWWNFVASSKERIERAKDDWRNGRFAKVAGDEREFIPLPEERS
jgi:redox-sensitive bicupin YhaK (pirin superfamily)